MERYTYFEDGKWRLRVGDTEYSGPWVDRLAAYEDTGLEPEEIITGEELAEIACALAQNLKYSALGTVEELTALVKARDEGREVVLPCKVGEHWKDCSGQEVIVEGFHWDKWSGWSVTFRFVDEEENGDDLSAVNFIYWAHNMTRAEAEAALGGDGDG